VWENINGALRESLREQAGRKSPPSAASVDSQKPFDKEGKEPVCI
jgi:hypothetical protein